MGCRLAELAAGIRDAVRKLRRSAASRACGRCAVGYMGCTCEGYGIAGRIVCTGGSSELLEREQPGQRRQGVAAHRVPLGLLLLSRQQLTAVQLEPRLKHSGPRARENWRLVAAAGFCQRGANHGCSGAPVVLSGVEDRSGGSGRGPLPAIPTVAAGIFSDDSGGSSSSRRKRF